MIKRTVYTAALLASLSMFVAVPAFALDCVKNDKLVHAYESGVDAGRKDAKMQRRIKVIMKRNAWITRTCQTNIKEDVSRKAIIPVMTTRQPIWISTSLLTRTTPMRRAATSMNTMLMAARPARRMVRPICPASISVTTINTTAVLRSPSRKATRPAGRNIDRM